MLFAILLFGCADAPMTGRPKDPARSCAGGEVLDGETCVPEACGVGTWGDLPVDAATVYVDVEAPGGGDGSEAAPLTSIQAGADLAAGRGGGLVAVAGGTYSEVIALGDDHGDVSVAGRCRDLVTIDGSGGDDVAAVEIIGVGTKPGISIEGLTVSAGTFSGFWLQHAIVSLTSVDVRDNTALGIGASHATVTLDGVAVYGTTPDRHGDFGRGVEVSDRASLTATGCSIEANTVAGVYADGAGTTVTLIDTRVVDTSPGPGGAWGLGLDVEGGASLAATRCTLQANTDTGVFATGAGTTVDLLDTEVLDTSPTPDGSFGRGVEVDDGATLTATGCTIRGNTDVGVVASGAETRLDLVDTQVLETIAGREGTLGGGIIAFGGMTLTATGGTIQGNTGVGISASGTGTVVDLVDTSVLDTLARSDGTYGRGLSVFDGAALTARGGTIGGNTEYGVAVTDPGTTVDLSDTQILDTSPLPDGTLGCGLIATLSARALATRCTVQGNTTAGVFADSDGTTVALVDTQVLSTSGEGIRVQAGATLTATGCTVQGNSGTGVIAGMVGTTVDLVDTRILDTVPDPEGAGGRGIDAGDGASVSATGCTVQGNSEVGVAASNAGTVVHLMETDILDTAPIADGTLGYGLGVSAGAALTTDRCTLQGNTDCGVFADGEATTVDLVDTEVLDTSERPDGGGGRGVGIQNGAALTAEGCTIAGNTEVGVLVTRGGAKADLADTNILDTHRGRAMGFALGLSPQFGAVVFVSDAEISGTEGPGFYAASDASADLDGVLVTGNTFAGVVLLDASVTLTRAAITDTLPDMEWGGGLGVYTHDEWGPPALTLLESTIGPHDYAAVWLDGPGSYDIEGNQLSGGTGIDQGGHTLHGNAVFAENGVASWDGTTGLLLADNALSGAAEIGVLLDGSSAQLESNSWSGNGTDVRQQDCDGEGVVPVTEDEALNIPSSLICPASNVITAYDLSFSSLYLPVSDTEE